MKKDIFSESSRLDSIANVVRKVFKRWDYKEIFLPSVTEYDERLRKGLKTASENKFYTVCPDPTSQISFDFEDEAPLRKYYIREILDDIDGTLQGGVEYICDDPLVSKVEILNVLISLLEELKIKEFYVDIGSLKVWKEAIQDISSYKNDIFKALKRRNLSLIDDLDIEKEKKEDLWTLLNTRGKTSGYKRIDELIEMIEDERFYADLGTVRPLPYYDDIIFEIYSPEIGTPLGAGGDYKLNGFYGCGFALNIELLSEVSRVKSDEDPIIVKGNLKTSYKKARRLVKEGNKVRMEEIK